MEQVGLISVVRFKSDRHAMTKGAKIFLADPSSYHALSGQEGNVQEALVVAMFRQTGKEIFACKDQRKGDFIVDGVTLEVGGWSKQPKGAAYVIRDGIERPTQSVGSAAAIVPLWMIASMF